MCDTFIKYKNKQPPISIEWLLTSQVKQCLSVSTEEWDDLEVLEEDRLTIEQHYTQKCISQQASCSAHLNQLMLSPRSYKIEKTKRITKTKNVNNNNKRKRRNYFLDLVVVAIKIYKM